LRKIQDQFPDSYFRIFAENELEKLEAAAFYPDEREKGRKKAVSDGGVSAAPGGAQKQVLPVTGMKGFDAQTTGTQRDIAVSDRGKYAIGEEVKIAATEQIVLKMYSGMKALIEPPVPLYSITVEYAGLHQSIDEDRELSAKNGPPSLPVTEERKKTLFAQLIEPPMPIKVSAYEITEITPPPEKSTGRKSGEETSSPETKEPFSAGPDIPAREKKQDQNGIVIDKHLYELQKVNGDNEGKQPETLGMLEPETIEETEPVAAQKTTYSVQLGAFTDKTNAVALRDKYQQKGYEAFLLEGTAADKLIYRMLIGRYEDRNASVNLARNISSKENVSTTVHAFTEYEFDAFMQPSDDVTGDAPKAEASSGAAKEPLLHDSKTLTEKQGKKTGLRVKEINAVKYKEGREDALSELQNRTGPYDVPVMRLDGEKISLYQISEAAYYASRVLSKMDIRSVIWRNGNLYEDFLVEHLLYRKALKEGVQINKPFLSEIAEQYSFNTFEKQYFLKYKVIEEFVKRKISAPAQLSLEMQRYYDMHKDEYIVDSGGKIVQSLILRYSETDRARKAKIAMELYHAALNGRSFIDIYNAHTGIVAFKETRYAELPNWIKEKTRHLSPAELHNLVSTLVVDNQFVIMKIILKDPVYERFEDVRPVIERRLSAGRQNRSGSIQLFLEGIRKEASALR
jgi:cell division protein FtsN